MLTKGDLKEIQNIVQTETMKIVQSETKKIVQSETKKIVQSETKKIIQAEFKPIKSDIVQIRKDMKMIINFFDKEYLEIRKRVERLEQHLNLPPLN